MGLCEDGLGCLIRFRARGRFAVVGLCFVAFCWLWGRGLASPGGGGGGLGCLFGLWSFEHLQNPAPRFEANSRSGSKLSSRAPSPH